MTKTVKKTLTTIQKAAESVDKIIQHQSLEEYAQQFFGSGSDSKLEVIFNDIYLKSLANFHKLELTDKDKQELAFKHKQLIIDLIKSKTPNLTVNNNTVIVDDKLNDNINKVLNINVSNETNSSGLREVSARDIIIESEREDQD